MPEASVALLALLAGGWLGARFASWALRRFSQG